MLCCFMKRGQPNQHDLAQHEGQKIAGVAGSRCLAPEGSVPVRLLRDPPWKVGSEAPRNCNENKSQVVLQGQEDRKPGPGAPVLTSGASHRHHNEAQGTLKQHEEGGSATGLRGAEQELGSRAQQVEGQLPSGQRLLREPQGKSTPAETSPKGPGLQIDKASLDSSKEAPPVPAGEKDKGKGHEKDASLNKDVASTSNGKASQCAHSGLPGSEISAPLLMGTPSSPSPKTAHSEDTDTSAAASAKQGSVGPIRKPDNKGKAPETAAEFHPSGGLLSSLNSRCAGTAPLDSLDSPLSNASPPAPLLALEDILPSLVSDPDSSDDDGGTEMQHKEVESEAREGNGIGQDVACPRIGRKGEDMVDEQKTAINEERPSTSSTHSHRPAPAPSLSPALKHLLEQVQTVQGQLLAHAANGDRWQRVLNRVEAIGELVLRNGSALGPEEVEALQSELQAVGLFLKMEQEEEAAEDLDRQLCSSLQEAYDEELAAHLAAQLHAQQDTTVECSICFEEYPSKDCVKAHVKVRITPQKEKVQASAASDGDEPAPCSHWHCVDCLRQYAAVKVLESRTCRIPCTAKGCPGFFCFEDLEWMLGDKERDVYTALLAEDTIAVKVYCPFDGCTAVMECAEGERGPDSLCPVCKRVFCRDCRVTWHQGQTCAQYASAKQDGPLHALAKKNKWKPCPKCQHMIERQDGCNFMQCKCGCGFCYKCGTAYTNPVRTGTNPHGTPGCKCNLFGR